VVGRTFWDSAVERISDEEMRCSFLGNVAVHREIVSEFAIGE
jgi:hypothetical protein